MKKIVYFNTEEEFLTFLKTKTKRYVDHGSEGDCFEGIDGLAYIEKITGIKNDFYPDGYNPEEVITSSEVKNKSFIFPDVLFAVKNKLVGYTSKLLPLNLLNSSYMILNGIDHIDFNKLIKAYCVFKEDVIKLSKDGIKIDDLPHNLMYDDKSLKAIDTCGYERTKEDTLETNLYSASEAIKDPFRMYLRFVYEIEVDKDRTQDPIEFLRWVEKTYKTPSKKKTRKNTYK